MITLTVTLKAAVFVGQRTVITLTVTLKAAVFVG